MLGYTIIKGMEITQNSTKGDIRDMSNHNVVPESLLKAVPEGTPQIELTRSMGFTINLQGYETARIDASVKVTGALENKDEILKLVESELESQMQRQIADVVSQHDPNKTLLGYRK